MVNCSAGVIGSLPVPSGLLNSLVANAERPLGCCSDLDLILVFSVTFQAALNPRTLALKDTHIDEAEGGGVWKRVAMEMTEKASGGLECQPRSGV